MLNWVYRKVFGSQRQHTERADVEDRPILNGDKFPVVVGFKIHLNKKPQDDS